MVFSTYTFQYLTDLPQTLQGIGAACWWPVDGWSSAWTTRYTIAFSTPPSTSCRSILPAAILTAAPCSGALQTLASGCIRTTHTVGEWVDLLGQAGFRLQRLLEPVPPRKLLDTRSGQKMMPAAPLRCLPQTIIFVAAKEGVTNVCQRSGRLAAAAAIRHNETMQRFTLPVAARILAMEKDNYRTQTFTLAARLTAQPGQFVMAWQPRFDEKPFSLVAADPVTLMITAVGPFTQLAHTLQPGDSLWIRGTFGNGFCVAPEQRHLALVGGGTGWPHCCGWPASSWQRAARSPSWSAHARQRICSTSPASSSSQPQRLRACSRCGWPPKTAAWATLAG
jgi:hypothetical protein